jgi:hypothetical protein
VKYYKINHPHIIHDTIDGEAILVNLKNGNYYSCDQTGAVCWDLISKGYDPGRIAAVMAQKFGMVEADVMPAVELFIRHLLDEGIILAAETSEETVGEDGAIDTLAGMEPPFRPPVLSKYTDMQDMLLLDPIHDTGEQGWPEPLKDNHAI